MKKNKLKTCPYCLIQLTYARQIGSYRLYECHSCRLLVTDLPSKFDINKSNTEIYSENYLQSYISRNNILEKRFANRISEIEALVKGGKILDVGCSTGLFLRTLENQSIYKWNLYGVDINKESIRYAKRYTKAKLYSNSLSEIDFPKHFFDCITCFDVIEHVEKLRLLLNKIKYLLKPGGLFLIQVPNNFSAMAFLSGEQWDWWSVPDHVFHFRPNSLIFILNQHGFKIKSYKTWDSMDDFVKIVRGSIKKRLPAMLSINKIVAKISTVPLIFLWFILKALEKQFDFGGLILVYATT